MNIGRNLLLAFLWVGGMAPTAICLLLAASMAGRPVPCNKGDCLNRTYGWDLLILPAGTLAPFIAGYWIARMGTKQRRFETVSRAIFNNPSSPDLHAINQNSDRHD
jgi:hypothetical protein